MNRNESASAVVHDRDRQNLSAYACCVAIILCSTVLQKVSLVGLATSLSINTALIPLISLYAFAFRKVDLNISGFFAFCIFALSGIISAIVGSTTGNPSLSALVLVLIVQFPLIFRPSEQEKNDLRIYDAFNNIMCVLCIGGIVQFVSQFAIGSRYSFFLDYSLPSWLATEGFGNLNNLSYGSTIFKSNGIFFLEPSFFGQYLALGAIIEILTKQRPSRILIYAGALLCSFSGTGLVTLGIFGTYILIKRGNLPLIVMIALFVVLVALFGDAIGIEAITGRVNELSVPGSSGHLRFVTPFQLINKLVFTDFSSIMFGRGPGAFATAQSSLEFGATDATWSKIVLEYGFVGFIVYVCFLYICIPSKSNPLLMPVILVYSFFGGYLTNASILALVLVLSIWSDGSCLSGRYQLKANDNRVEA